MQTRTSWVRSDHHQLSPEAALTHSKAIWGTISDKKHWQLQVGENSSAPRTQRSSEAQRLMGEPQKDPALVSPGGSSAPWAEVTAIKVSRSPEHLVR